MLNYQLEILVEEFVTSIGYSDEFYVNLLFTAISIDRCAHIWVWIVIFQGKFEF